MSELRPLNDNIIVIPYIQKKTNSGIILAPETVKNEIPPAYIISALGPDVKNKELKEGTVVMIPRKTGTWVPFEGFKYILVNESDIIAILEGATYESITEESYERM